MKKDTKKVVAKPKEEAPAPKGIVINQSKLGLTAFLLVKQFKSQVVEVEEGKSLNS